MEGMPNPLILRDPRVFSYGCLSNRSLSKKRVIKRTAMPPDNQPWRQNAIASRALAAVVVIYPAYLAPFHRGTKQDTWEKI